MVMHLSDCMINPSGDTLCVCVGGGIYLFSRGHLVLCRIERDGLDAQPQSACEVSERRMMQAGDAASSRSSWHSDYKLEALKKTKIGAAKSSVRDEGQSIATRRAGNGAPSSCSLSDRSPRIPRVRTMISTIQ